MATATTSATKRMDDVTPHIVDIMPKAQACADLVGRRDWSTTALGPFDGWPASLKITLATMMRSPVPRTSNSSALGSISTLPAPLRRELAEEVGLHDAEVGPHIWNRLHVIPFIDGRYDGQEERVHLVRTEAFEPRPALSWEDLAAEYVFGLRWWRIDEITDGLPFVPASLRTHLDRLLTDGPPNPPVDVGV